jgi:hypothetical protein
MTAARFVGNVAHGLEQKGSIPVARSLPEFPFAPS